MTSGSAMFELASDGKNIKDVEEANVDKSKTNLKVVVKEPHQPTPELITYGGIKLGWIQGVLIPCLLNIWGVMLFLRIAWIVAQAGIGCTLAIIGLATIVCVITTLSLSAICTNGEVKGGGVYYLVSRSLGAELGASVGLLFAFANAVAASMNTIGFCDSLNELLRSHGAMIFDNGVNDVRVVGAVALLVMCFICAIGMDWETKTQNFLIVIIVLAIVNYIIGALVGPRTTLEKAQGFVGVSAATATENWLPDYRWSEGVQHDFFSVFAMYFPAVTGVQAGANICGDLRDPASAIPKGTLTALVLSTSCYVAMAALSGTGALRDASGFENDYTAGTLDTCKPQCEYGLHNNYAIMQLMSFWGPLTYGGCWAATLSTALTNLLSVPRLIQALGIDRIYPGLIFFSKPYGKHGEPYRGYILVFFVSLLFLLVADLNAIAPLITNFYLASYALINFCTFHAGFVHHISWRPRFKYYDKWLSLLGFVMCVTIMMIISWIMALITFFLFWILYFLVMYRSPDTSWGSSTEAQGYNLTVSHILVMTHRAEHAKSYNPQVLVLAGKPYARPALLDIGHLITKDGPFMIVAEIHPTQLSNKEREERQKSGDDWIHSRNNRGFYVLADGMSRVEGVRALAHLTGLGRLAPNLILIGYKDNWLKVSHEDLSAYYQIINCAFEVQQSVTIFRVCQHGPIISSLTLGAKAKKRVSTARGRVLAVMNSSSDIALGDASGESTMQNTITSATYKGGAPPRGSGIALTLSVSTSALSLLPSPSRSMTHRSFTLDVEKNLDVWWLYDDGGLNILLPYIIANRGFKDKKMSMRIFALARQQYREDEAKQFIKDLLVKFRIRYSSLTIVTGIGDPPANDTWDFYHRLVQNFMTKEPDPQECLITTSQLASYEAKSSRYLRLRELLLAESSHAGLIVMSLPYPRKVAAALYMTWLEILSRDLPPTLFVRGNKSVLQM